MRYFSGREGTTEKMQEQFCTARNHVCKLVVKENIIKHLTRFLSKRDISSRPIGEHAC